DNNGIIYNYNRPKVSVSEDWSKDIYLNNQAFLEYKKSIIKHSFSLMGGVTTENDRIDYISARANGFPNNVIREISGTTGTGSDISGTSSASDWVIASLIGRAVYSYDNKYL